MAPKVKRSRGKDVQEYDESKFVSFEASERFISLMHVRRPIPERGFTITERENPVLYRMISNRNWEAFCAQPHWSITNLVREFYANAEEHRRGRTVVRNKTIDFSSSAINQYFGLPDIPNSEYASYRTQANYDDICNTLCVPGSVWKMSGGSPKTLAGTSLTVEARAWQYFVCQKMMPATHFSDLTVDKAVLIYAILRGMSIDAGRVIFDSIIHTVRNKLGLYFPSLITQLCLEAGVRHGPDEEAQYPTKPIDDRMLISLRRSRSHTPEVEGGEAVAPPPSRRDYTVAERLERLEIRFDEHQQFVRDRFDRQDQFLSRQADYQAAVHSSFGQMFQSFASSAGCDMGSFPNLPPYPGSFFDPAPDPAPPEEHDG